MSWICWFQHFTFEAWLLVPADAAPEGLFAPSCAVAMLLGWLPASCTLIAERGDVPSGPSAAQYQ